MPKIIVINGLTRSGTNLVSSMISAQDYSLSSDFFLLELLFLQKYIQNLDIENIELIKAEHVKGIEKNMGAILDESTLKAYNILFPNSRSIKNDFHTNCNKFYGLDATNIIEYLNDFYKCNKLDDFLEKYLNFASSNNLEVLATRITGILPYADYLLNKSDNVFWIEVVRNPVDRYYSAKRSHTVSPLDSFLQSSMQEQYIKKVEDNKNFILVKYEDIVEDPENILKKIYSRLNVDLKEFNLYGITPDSNVFYGNSSDNGKKNLFRQEKKKEKIYKKNINMYDNLSKFEKYAASKFGYIDKENINIFYEVIYYISYFIQKNTKFIYGIFSYLEVSLRLIGYFLVSIKYIGFKNIMIIDMIRKIHGDWKAYAQKKDSYVKRFF